MFAICKHFWEKQQQQQEVNKNIIIIKKRNFDTNFDCFVVAVDDVVGGEWREKSPHAPCSCESSLALCVCV